MTQDARHGFRARAKLEADRYGPDPWIFVRELLQNGRDAGAGHITITVHEGPGWAKIRCRDDGEGMSFDHARRYLFSLYASSKEASRNQVGRFGVGFWSILRFEPTRIVIRSRHGSEPAWEVTLDGALEHAQQAEISMGHGTEIVLERDDLAPDDPRDLERRVFDAAHQNGRFLCLRDDPETPLPVQINGRSINEPFSLPAPAARFHRSHVRGVVGLGSAPRVELFSRGLRVRSAACLDDLLTNTGHTAHSRVRFPELPGALAPQALLESDGLELLLSRNDARDTRTLRRLVKLAHGELRHLVERQIDEIHPPGPLERLASVIRRIRPETTVARAITGAAVGAVLALGIARVLWPSAISSETEMPVVAESGDPLELPVAGRTQIAERERYGSLAQLYHGPQVSELDPTSARPVELHYSPTDRRPYFAALLIETPGSMRRAIELSGDSYAGSKCRDDCIDVELAIDGAAGPLVVPVPTGHDLDPDSVRIDDTPASIAQSTLGEPIVVLPRATQGMLRYRTGRGSAKPRPRRLGVSVQLPEQIAAEARALSRLPIEERVEMAIRLTQERVRYDTSAETASHHRRAIAERTPFIERALQIGAGDCDVQNGVLVAVLQRAEVPARLAIGFVGVDGGAAPWMHAWVEFLDESGRWRIADTTAGAPSPAPGMPTRPPTDAVIAVAPGPPSTAAELHEPHEPQPSAEAALASEPSSSSDAHDAWDAPAAERPGSEPGIAERMPGGFRQLHPAIPLGGAGLMLLAAVAWLLARRRSDRQLEVDDKGDISPLLQGALQQPGAFRQLPALFHRRIIPLRNGKLTSLMRARARAGAGRLYAGAEFTELSRRAVARGVPVLDAESPEGRTVANSLGATDLDHWGGLMARAETTPILEALNTYVQRAGEPWRIEAVARLQGDISTLDLDELGLRNQKRIILLDSNNPWLVSASAQLATRPAAALFALLDYVVDHLDLDSQRRAELLSRQAGAAMIEAARATASGRSP